MYGYNQFIWVSHHSLKVKVAISGELLQHISGKGTGNEKHTCSECGSLNLQYTTKNRLRELCDIHDPLGYFLLVWATFTN